MDHLLSMEYQLQIIFFPVLREYNPHLYSDGAVAQLGERLPCKQEVIGSIPFSSTKKVLKKYLKVNKKMCYIILRHF